PAADARLAVTSEELAGLAVALEDLRGRIVPTLGNAPAATALGSALADLGEGLSRSAGALEGALGRATAAATALRADAALQPDLDVVLLVLERIAAAARGPGEPASTVQRREL
ncbi:MAG: hypothetical protein ACREMC_10110, partial [Gemmatimonadales bacterium]